MSRRQIMLALILGITVWVIIYTLATAAHAACGNTAFNISRLTECEAYTSDWAVHKDLRDKRQEAISEWTEQHPASSQMLDLMLKEGLYRRSTSLTGRDSQIYPDKDMWLSRGCASLPVCTIDKVDKAEKPEKPAKRAEPRNRRTGGNYCGPRDRRRGYCD